MTIAGPTQRRPTPSLVFWLLTLSTTLRNSNRAITSSRKKITFSPRWVETQKPAICIQLPSLIYSIAANRRSHQPRAYLCVERQREKRSERKRCLPPLSGVQKTPFSPAQRRKQAASAASAVPQPWQHARTCTRISSGSTKTMKCGEAGSYIKHIPAMYKIRKAAASKAQSPFYQKQSFN